MDFGKLSADDLLIFPGGGYLVPQWAHQHLPVIARALKYDFPFLFLPQTALGQDELFLRLRERDTIFAREHYTEAYLDGLQIAPSVHLDHDMAFSTDVSLLKQRQSYRPPLTIKTGVKFAFLMWHIARSKWAGSLDAFRVDSESAMPGAAPVINDISLISQIGNGTKAQHIMSARRFLGALGRYKNIRTDRLHVIIGCIINGIPVEAYQNNYHKVRGVMEYSILPYPERARLVKWMS